MAERRVVWFQQLGINPAIDATVVVQIHPLPQATVGLRIRRRLGDGSPPPGVRYGPARCILTPGVFSTSPKGRNDVQQGKGQPDQQPQA